MYGVWILYEHNKTRIHTVCSNFGESAEQSILYIWERNSIAHTGWTLCLITSASMWRFRNQWKLYSLHDDEKKRVNHRRLVFWYCDNFRWLQIEETHFIKIVFWTNSFLRWQNALCTMDTSTVHSNIVYCELNHRVCTISCQPEIGHESIVDSHEFLFVWFHSAVRMIWSNEKKRRVAKRAIK